MILIFIINLKNAIDIYDKIKILDETFVNNHKGKYKLVYNSKEQNLKSTIDIKKIKIEANKLEIQLKEV